jgi:anti-anti-sigma factor
MSFEQKTFKGGNQSIIIHGDFDALSLSQNGMRQQLESVIETAEGNIQIDLSKVEFMDSSGIGAMVFLFKRLKSRGLRLEILQPVGQPRQLLEMLRINEAIPVQLIN